MASTAARPGQGHRSSSTSSTSSSSCPELVRCDCGKLLARVVRSAIELKCPRCKRVVILVDGRRFEPACDRGEVGCGCLEGLDAAAALEFAAAEGGPRSGP